MFSDIRTPTQIDPKRAIPREEHLRNTRYFVGGLAPIQCGGSFPNMERSSTPRLWWTVTGRSKGFAFEDNSNDVGHLQNRNHHHGRFFPHQATPHEGTTLTHTRLGNTTLAHTYRGHPLMHTYGGIPSRIPMEASPHTYLQRHPLAHTYVGRASPSLSHTLCHVTQIHVQTCTYTHKYRGGIPVFWLRRE